MRAVKQKLVFLTCALAVCIAASLLLTYTGRTELENEQKPTYLFTNLSSQDALLYVNIENETGSVLLAQVNGEYFAVGDTEADFPAEHSHAAALYGVSWHLTLDRLLENATSADPQYGLTEPSAKVFLQDTSGEGVYFLLGVYTPDGSGVYSCLSGDERVFVMPADSAALYLDSVNRCLDLQLYPVLNGNALSRLKSVTVTRNGVAVYSALLESVTESGSAVISLENPFHLLLGLSQAKNALVSPLQALRGVRCLPAAELPEAYGMADDSNSFSLAYSDGSTVTVRVGRTEGTETYVWSDAIGLVMTVPASALSFYEEEPARLAGPSLLDLPLGSIRSLEIGQTTYEITGEGNALAVAKNGIPFDTETFQTNIYTSLTRLSVLGAFEPDMTMGEKLGDLSVTVSYSATPLRFSFHAMDGRTSAVVIDGRPVLLCSTAIVRALLSAAA